MGTWSLPQTKTQAEELMALLEQPLTANDAPEKLYYLLGDDGLYDVIAKARNAHGDNADVRVFVKTFLARFLQEQDQAFEPYEPEAVALLSAACIHYLPPEMLGEIDMDRS